MKIQEFVYDIFGDKDCLVRTFVFQEYIQVYGSVFMICLICVETINIIPIAQDKNYAGCLI